VISATASSTTLAEAHRLAYEAVNAVQFSGGFFRRDIGATALRVHSS
jgi:phosphoribosylamine-glycine ligase